MGVSKPLWLKRRIPVGPAIKNYARNKGTLDSLRLNTVCEEARCPNINECWGGGTATFMVMGDECTRGCRFCHVKTRRNPQALDPFEPFKLVQAVKAFGLKYVVITSVDRDELEDQGAGHFARCIAELRKQLPDLLIEVLTPDFRGQRELVETVAAAKPHVFAHNIETTEELQRGVRDPRAGYAQSLSVLKKVKEFDSGIYTKSSIMLGLGEKEGDVLQAMDDLRKVGCDVFTLGQYLQPSPVHLPVQEFVSPEKFAWYRERALEKGFLYVASGPFVRSSYKAGELFLEGVIKAKAKAGPAQAQVGAAGHA